MKTSQSNRPWNGLRARPLSRLSEQGSRRCEASDGRRTRPGRNADQEDSSGVAATANKATASNSKSMRSGKKIRARVPTEREVREPGTFPQTESIIVVDGTPACLSGLELVFEELDSFDFEMAVELAKHYGTVFASLIRDCLFLTTDFLWAIERVTIAAG